MTGEIIINIYVPKKEGWCIIEVDKANYSLRLGGYKVEEAVNSDLYEIIDLPFQYKRVEEIYSDDEWVYIIVESGYVISSGWVDVDQNGIPKLGLSVSELNDFEDGFFEDCCFKIHTDGNGNSVRKD